jgi:hypothetical protein
MKSKLCTCLFLLPFVLLLVFVACNKADHSDTDQTGTSVDTSTFSTSSSQCPNAPNYGDSILYLKPKTGGDFFAQPTNNNGIQGTWLCWPEGLSLNQANGTINLSKSETGVRYKIGFVKKNTTDTCVSQLIIGGMTYLDSIYVMDKNDTLASPIFDANPYGPSICDVSDDTDYPDNNANGNTKCVFDDASPGQRANDLKLRVRTKSGVINLKKSLADGLFGPVLRNGTSRLVRIAYRLNDASQRAPQQITVQVMYYDKVSSIPTSLQQEVMSKRINMFTYQVANSKPRPPLLIIAGLSY